MHLIDTLLGHIELALCDRFVGRRAVNKIAVFLHADETVGDLPGTLVSPYLPAGRQRREGLTHILLDIYPGLRGQPAAECEPVDDRRHQIRREGRIDKHHVEALGGACQPREGIKPTRGRGGHFDHHHPPGTT